MKAMAARTYGSLDGPGYDFAGTVEAVGDSVTRFQPGDDASGGTGADHVVDYTRDEFTRTGET